MSADEEIWKPIPGYSPYEASSHGRIRVGPLPPGQPLKPSKSPAGYPNVTLWRGIRKSFTVHALVALTFLGPRPPGKETVAHNDGDPGNPRPDNLRWASWSENHHDKHAHGTMPHQRGEDHGMARLTGPQVLGIVELSKTNLSQREIGRRYGIRQGAVSKIVLGERWSHVTGIPKPFNGWR